MAMSLPLYRQWVAGAERRVAIRLSGEARHGADRTPEQRVKADLSGMVVQGAAFSQNVREALGTIVRQTSTDPTIYLVELLFSFKGVKRVEVPAAGIQPA
jgi:hypothetical protein